MLAGVVFELSIHTAGWAERGGEGVGRGSNCEVQLFDLLQAQVQLNMRASSRLDMVHKANVSFI
jgi:hypothetical protein